MNKIVEKKVLNPIIKLMKIEAPLIAKKAKAGQFIMLRIDENGERVPFTIAECDKENGLVTIIFQEVGKSTIQLGNLNVGDYIRDFVGPLGTPTHYGKNIKKVAIIGGGLGTAIAYPQAKELNSMGVEVDVICGFRNKDIIILEEEMKSVSCHLYITTDDGSNGNKGFVTDQLKNLIKAGNEYDLVIAIGPLIMMKFICLLTKEYNIKTIVSLNTVMVDGTGMCGGCRVTVGSETKFACVDGPDFDGHLVDFDEAMRRHLMYKPHESKSLEKHKCNLENIIK